MRWRQLELMQAEVEADVQCVLLFAAVSCSDGPLAHDERHHQA